MVPFGAPSHLAAFTGVYAVMEPRGNVPAHLAQEHHTSGLWKKRHNDCDQREKSNQNKLVNRDLKRKEGCKLALTGECACKTTRSLGDCGVTVGC